MRGTRPDSRVCAALLVAGWLCLGNVAASAEAVASRTLASGARSTQVEVVADELLVTFRPEVSEDGRRTLLEAAGFGPVRSLRAARGTRASRTQLVHIATGSDLARSLDTVRRLPGVEDAQPNYVYRALQQTNDPYYSLQWAQENTGDDSAYTLFGLRGPDPRVPGADMGAGRARAEWSGPPPAPVVVGVVDTGIDLSHPDLASRIWTNPDEVPGNGLDDDGNGYVDDVHGWDFVDGDAEPLDGNGHGTHVAGVIGAATDNAVGVAGTAPNVVLMPLRFLDDSGSGATSDAIDAIFYALGKGARVLNNSWGSGAFDTALWNAIDSAESMGVLFVAAAGNHASDDDLVPQYPSNYANENVVSVAASTAWRDLGDFSNWGRISVDLAAPGDEILSTTPVAGSSGLPETAYQIAFPSAFGGNAPWSSTSMAAAAVSGGAALLFGLGEELWPGAWQGMSPVEQAAAVKDRLLDRSARWASLSGRVATGGHLDLQNLLTQDDVPPDPVGSSLQAVAPLARSVVLRWLATGDDGSTGRANHYVLRYQPGPTIDFDHAPEAERVWTPGLPGASEHFRLFGLEPDTQYTIGLEVVDDAGNHGPRTELTTTTEPASVLFADDAESGTNGWTADSPWALTTLSSHSTSHAWTDSPTGSYSRNLDVSLTSPEIETSGAEVSLSFWQRHAIESGFDFGYVEARAFDAGSWGSWTNVLTVTGTNLTWHEVSAALPVSGERVQVRFRLETDGAIQMDGWYVDDVAVENEGVADTVVLHDGFDGNDCSGWQLAGAWGCELDTLSDSPGMNYPTSNRASATLAAPLDLEDSSGAKVSFSLPAFDYELDYDFLLLQYSLDGTSWRTFRRMSGNIPSGTQVVDARELAGQPTVYLRFLSLSDEAYSHSGARIDDVEVRAISLPEPSAAAQLALGAGFLGLLARLRAREGRRR